ncbi:MAG: aminoacyl-tRNA hydrolase [Flammeovirgaceae bacterium TMED290]|nr:MAG: aminoacyl-tRNA hydrolase [Flammeovirgaceae bacterium TMED290]|tara:strand:+ start:582 stop:1139 length:558 start_codon:yes stop_codon:yes gene_type:complete
MKYLIVGLGNIGEDYKGTRHNIGFAILDYLSKKFNSDFSVNKYAEITSFNLKGKKVNLIKPTSYVNNSGKAVNYWFQKKGIRKENLLVIIDDIALPFGKIRLKKTGSHGGHNGLKSIDDHLNDRNYSRLRFGIDNNFRKGQQSKYVLSKFSKEEGKELDFFIINSCEVIESFILQGSDATMNTYN